MRKNASMEPREPTDGPLSEGQIAEAHNLGVLINKTIDYTLDGESTDKLVSPRFCTGTEFPAAFNNALEEFEVTNLSNINEEGSDIREDEPSLLYVRRRASEPSDAPIKDSACYIIHDAFVNPDNPTYKILSHRRGDIALRAMEEERIKQDFTDLINSRYYDAPQDAGGRIADLLRRLFRSDKQ